MEYEWIDYPISENESIKIRRLTYGEKRVIEEKTGTFLAETGADKTEESVQLIIDKVFSGEDKEKIEALPYYKVMNIAFKIVELTYGVDKIDKKKLGEHTG